ncbi:rCG47530 [Rattus norvegicus]|uniref:RCG47530 n=1 Tax=Rattus norvegicus TaxID=10116 RepID=A6I0S4_RAT|nr:rCG47530 [Rattus norvegicus]
MILKSCAAVKFRTNSFHKNRVDV